MSKQYLTTHTIDDAHPTDIFSLASTSTHLITGSGASSLKVYSTATSDFPLLQTLKGHAVGCHHVCASADGNSAASAGFGGEVRLWKREGGEDGDGMWKDDGKITDGNKAGEIWAIVLSTEGQYLASTTIDGRINVWDLAGEDRKKIREYETKGSFGMCIDMSTDGTMTASGHASGAIYIFANSTSRLLHSLPSLINPVRSVRFSPSGTLLAAAGDSKVIGLYTTSSGEQIAALSGHASWILSVAWSPVSGEYLLSTGWDGKVKVWRTETRLCVATHGESDRAVWTGCWLSRMGGRNGVEGFATAGAAKSISFFREAAGG